MALMLLLAQTDVTGGNVSGWAGAAGWSATAVLVMVLSWLLFKYLPEKDAQINKFISEKAAEISDKDKVFIAAITAKDMQFIGLIKDKDVQVEKKDAQIEKMLDRKNEQLKQMIEAHNSDVKVRHEENRRALDQIIMHCKEETASTGELMRQTITAVQQDMNQLSDAVTELSESIKEGRHRQATKKDRQLPPSGGTSQ